MPAQKSDYCKNIYPELEPEYPEIIDYKIRHLVDVLKNNSGSYSLRKLSADTGLDKNKFGRIRNLKYKFSTKDIEALVTKLNKRYPFLELTVQMFWANTPLESFQDYFKLKPHHSSKYSSPKCLPRIDYKFKKRENDISKLKNLIIDSDIFLINIFNPGCVGKTALAIEVAKQLAQNGDITKTIWITARNIFFQGDSLVVRPSLEMNLGNVLDEILTNRFEINECTAMPLEDKLKSVNNILSSEESVLLIIDNFESIKDENILDFLFKLPDSTKVITTCRDTIPGIKPFPISRLTDEDIKAIINEPWSTVETSLTENEIEQILNKCDGDLLAVKWMKGIITTDNISVDLLLSTFKNDNFSVLEHIFNFAFSKITACSKHLLLTLANAQSEISGHLIDRSVQYSTYEIEKSLVTLIKYGLVSELKDETLLGQRGPDLNSHFTISAIAAIYIKKRLKNEDLEFTNSLLKMLEVLLNDFYLNENIKHEDVYEFFAVWSGYLTYYLRWISNPNNGFINANDILLDFIKLLNSIFDIESYIEQGLVGCNYIINRKWITPIRYSGLIEFIHELLLTLDDLFFKRQDLKNEAIFITNHFQLKKHLNNDHIKKYISNLNNTDANTDKETTYEIKTFTSDSPNSEDYTFSENDEYDDLIFCRTRIVHH